MTYTEDQVRRETLKYFNGDELATNVWISKYALKDREGNLYELTPKDMHRRLAKEAARIEQKYINPLSEQQIFELLDKFKFLVPQGSPMFGIGNYFTITSLSNCFVIGSNEDSDSYGSIMRTDQEQIQLMKRRGGVGHDISHLRPSGAMANNSVLKGMAGSTLYMERYSNSTREVSQGDRRGALMLSIDVTHPDAEKFIDAKLEQGKVTGANISIKARDSFMDSVKEDSDFWQKFPITADISTYTDRNNHKYGELEDHLFCDVENNTNYSAYIKRIKAKELWNKIIHNAWKSAEPGLLFWDTILRESPAACYGKEWQERSVNPCAELPLCEYDSCRLLAINLYSYVNDKFTENAHFNFELFKYHVNIAQRLMDDIVDLEIEKIDKILDKINSDPESEDLKRVELNLWTKIKEKAIQGRRTGLGITGLGDMLAALNLRYGSEEAIEFSEEVHRVLAVESYKSSINLAKERGCFPSWDYEKEKENPFIKRIALHLGHEGLFDYRKYGRRNIANLTIAPTGSVSICTQTTSGIEPCFQVYYKRRRKVNDKSKATFIDELGDMWEEYKVFHHKFVEWFKINVWNDLIHKSDRFALLGNTPLECLNNITKEQLEEFVKQSPYYKATSSDVDYLGKVEMQGKIQKWVDHSISVTVNMPENVSEETVSQVYMKAYEVGCKGVTVYREGSRNGVLISDKKEEKQPTEAIIYNDAPKRPKTLKCDIYTMSRSKQSFTIIVGLLGNRPYEIFALEKLDNLEFCDKIQKGELKKVKSRTYQLIGDYKRQRYIVDNIVEHMSDDEQKDTRKYSIQLRHGIHPKYIVEQINEFAAITSFDKVIAKVLSNYLGDKKIKGEEVCPNCGGQLKYESGCVQCLNPECGWSKCS